MEKWFVYILRCKDRSLYTGISLDVKRRFQEHKEGRGGKYTRSFKSDKIVYSEGFTTKGEALKRERQIKRWCREKKDNLIKNRIPKEPA